VGDAWGNVSKAFKVPVIVNKIFIIIGIEGGRSKDNATKYIMIGLGLHALTMSSMGMNSGIWMNMKAHGWIWIKLRFWMEDFKGMLSKSEDFAFLCARFGSGCINLRID